jgi:hypothetical protein
MKVPDSYVATHRPVHGGKCSDRHCGFDSAHHADHGDDNPSKLTAVATTAECFTVFTIASLRGLRNASFDPSQKQLVTYRQDNRADK